MCFRPQLVHKSHVETLEPGEILVTYEKTAEAMKTNMPSNTAVRSFGSPQGLKILPADWIGCQQKVKQNLNKRMLTVD